MSRDEPYRRTAWYLWPLVAALSRLVAALIEVAGRSVAIVLGFTLVVAGALVSLTIVGAIVGIPMVLIGGMLVARGLF